MTIQASILTQCRFIETLTGTFIDPNDGTFAVTGLASSQSLNADSTPPVTKGTQFSIALSSGTGTINLASLTPPDTSLSNIDGTGLKVQSVKFSNPSTNANAISVTEGASSGHPLLGPSFLFSLEPGQSLTFANEGVDVGTDIASGDRTWDLAGTGSQALDVAIVMG